MAITDITVQPAANKIAHFAGLADCWFDDCWFDDGAGLSLVDELAINMLDSTDELTEEQLADLLEAHRLTVLEKICIRFSRYASKYSRENDEDDGFVDFTVHDAWSNCIDLGDAQTSRETFLISWLNARVAATLDGC